MAVFSALADKDVAAIAAVLAPWLQAWHLGPIVDAGPRGLDAEVLAGRLAGVVAADRVRVHRGLAAARAAAAAEIGPAGRVLVFGSFHTVAEALAAAEPHDAR